MLKRAFLLRISSYALVLGIVQTCAFSRGSTPKADGNAVHDEHRREFLSSMLLTTAVSVQPFQANADAVRRDATQINIGILDPNLKDYYDPSLPNWKGTSLPGPLSLSEACARLVDSEPVLTMGRWPDPILRHPAANIPLSVFQNKNQLEQLQLVATALSNTARKEGAVGLGVGR
ncbi:hypothetical protein ACHAW5_008564 [Stephanodiscus triporus]|uniref:Uncharacterized protein n=1 Tax=Stephanodiscus triporus TaxID=2934178 RepID=A0ABD3NI45_9STRA